ncbi:VPLPA-CTERM sorting domain-containing protein [Hyphococcus sp.]|uniref:VPLPA-CTERM sorting domain-containing protein n=1 Tax=Hyphococcus sp. TaxID=2038636 RepID=UPI003CCBD3E9
MDVGIEDENVAAGAYVAEGSFEVATAAPANGLVDVNFDGQSGSVPSGFNDLTISFEQDSIDLGTFTITDAAGFQILNQFVLAIASTSDIFFEITGFAFNDGVTLPDYNIRMSAVPIPGAIPLLLSGIAGLGFAARRRKQDA